MKKNVIIVSIFIVLFAVAAALLALQKKDSGNLTVCTLEALVCPDGSAVGRSGPECSFNPCPDTPSFAGIFQNVGERYQLVIETPDEIQGDVTYALPLELRTTNVIAGLLGKQVRIRGTFIEGNTYTVESLEEIPQEYGAPTAVVGAGESALIGYVKVTLNEIVEDSRCPVDATCIQEGRVVANVTLESDTDQVTTNISTDDSPLAFDAFHVSIVDIVPARVVSHVPEQHEYRITFMVEQIGDN